MYCALHRYDPGGVTSIALFSDFEYDGLLLAAQISAAHNSADHVIFSAKYPSEAQLLWIRYMSTARGKKLCLEHVSKAACFGVMYLLRFHAQNTCLVDAYGAAVYTVQVQHTVTSAES